MRSIEHAAEVINPSVLKPKSVIYTAGNAATPQTLLQQLAEDLSIQQVALYSILPLGERISGLFSQERCKGLTHRVLFNSHLSRAAVNKGWAKYHPMHLSEIPKYALQSEGPDVVLLSVAGPDNGGNFSLGPAVEAIPAAIEATKSKGGLVIAERNRKMPFVIGSTIPTESIDYLIDSDYPLPVSPVREADEKALKIGEIIASLYIKDGSGRQPGSTLQYGIGEVPDAVTSAILQRGIRDLSVHTELFASGMRRLLEHGAVSNRWKQRERYSVSTFYLAENQAGYDWLDFNSSVQLKPCEYTNSVFTIAQNPNMVAINSAIGVDLHSNIWADSLDARKIYSGVGGQSDFIRGAQYSPGGIAIIALKSETNSGKPKILDRCPAGITTTAIPADNVILVTEHGAFDPRNLSLTEHAVGIAHLAAPEQREKLLKTIYDDPFFHNPERSEKRHARGFVPYEDALAG